MKCYEVVEMILEEADKQFAPFWQSVSEKKKELEACCNAIDKFAKITDATGYEIEVDDITLDIRIEVFWEKENSEAKVGFVFLGVWEHVSFCKDNILVENR